MPSIRLEAVPQSTAVARRFVTEALQDVPVDQDLAALLVSELVSNVIVHAATGLEVSVTVGSTVRVAVRDGAAVTEAFRDLVSNPPRQVRASAKSGRGWMLVSRLASDFGLIDHGAHGKTVWFELPVGVGRGLRDLSGTERDQHDEEAEGDDDG